MDTVIFACVRNAGRSQMVAAFFNAFADPAKAHAVSAARKPGERVHPEVNDGDARRGHRLSGVKPRLLADEFASTPSLLITMGCSEACPLVPGLEAAIGIPPIPRASR